MVQLEDYAQDVCRPRYFGRNPLVNARRQSICITIAVQLMIRHGLQNNQSPRPRKAEPSGFTPRVLSNRFLNSPA